MELKDLNKEKLLDVISKYDEYIQEANKTFTDNWMPITIEEFYINLY